MSLVEPTTARCRGHGVVERVALNLPDKPPAPGREAIVPRGGWTAPSLDAVLTAVAAHAPEQDLGTWRRPASESGALLRLRCSAHALSDARDPVHPLRVAVGGRAAFPSPHVIALAAKRNDD